MISTGWWHGCSAAGDIAFTISGEPVSLNNKTEDEIFNFITKKQYVEKLLMEERVRVSDREKEGGAQRDEGAFPHHRTSRR